MGNRVGVWASNAKSASDASDRTLDAHLMIGRYDQASLPLIHRLRREQQDHPGDEGIPAGLREPHQ